MRQSRIKTIIGALLLLPLLGACQSDAQIQINPDLTASGTIHLNVPKTEINADDASCQALARNVNQVQKQNHQDPRDILTLSVAKDDSNAEALDCTLEFKNFNPNVNKTVLYQEGNAYTLLTKDPAEFVRSLAVAPENVKITLTFPTQITGAQGGKINGNTITFNSLDELTQAPAIVAGDPTPTTWETLRPWVLGVGALVLISLTAYVLWWNNQSPENKTKK
ncbi:hypothetical protein BSR28_01225 [Boudabousia liubingyangii]|uniref:LppM family (lipo)protein n=1 Tax=Boudabousia liubingyangii TaxID=1921764 RepID=UPI00093C6459|nr:hypothetical protein [Boudabousia liubingyangii]OKL48352.1 hypothetical protein BSR28_01225 [Boudabousia liubingyangii]